ncbi:MAG TPA: aromatic ring-hydroxylating dioxygenase subunit alpha [Gaiellaceae bacterium]|jgi:choline monooxygenase
MAATRIEPEIAEALAEGMTLPASWYGRDPAIHELELERIFRRSWQYVARTEQVAEPGTFAASRAGHVPVVIARDQEGELRGFVNVCRHRGHLVAQGEGRRASLQCPYHAWTYGLDGCLRAAPRSEREPGFDFERYSLLPISVDAWGPFVFANPDPDAAPLAEAFGRLGDYLLDSGIDWDRLRFRERLEYTSSVNWKVGIENYLECYHCPVAHPSFSKLIDVDPDAYLLRADGLLMSQFGPLREGGPAKPYDPTGEVKQAQYHLLWPNLTINIEPGPPNLSVDTWMPAGPHDVIGFTDYFFGEDVPDEKAREIMAFGAQVGQEDMALVESVQQGLDSGMVPNGRLLPESEQLIQHFQRLLYEALA